MATPSPPHISTIFFSSHSPPPTCSQNDNHVYLPQPVDALIVKICRDQCIDPPDDSALLKLYLLGQEVSMDILRKIERSKVRKSFSALLMHLVKQHESARPCNTPPVRVLSSEEQVMFQPESMLTSQLMNTNQLPPTAPTTPQAVCSPTTKIFENHGSAHRRLQFIGLRANPYDPHTEGPTRPTNASPQMLALGELEFRKAFLILSYLGRNKLEEKMTVELIESLKNVPMRPFELKIFELLGGDHISSSDRRKDTQWDTSKTYVYKCHVYLNGNVTFKGPFLEPDQTHLQRALGDDNILQVSFEEEKTEMNEICRFNHYSDVYQRVARDGIMLGLRRYQFLVYKDGGKEESKKNSTSYSVKCYFVRTDSGWAMDQYDGFLCGTTVKEIRLAFMHIHTVPTFAKYMPRFSLILSKTMKLDLDLSIVNVEHIDDIPCMDGSITKKGIHTDGIGFISEDLALQCPLDVFKGKFLTGAKPLMEGSMSRKRQRSRHSNEAPPLLLQVRLFYKGLAAKGTLLVNRKLPRNTIQIRPSMIKVESDSSIWVQPFNSLEVVNTSSRSRKVYLSRMLISLLHYGGVPTEFFLGLLSGALFEIENCFSDRVAALNFIQSHSGLDDDDLLLRMLYSKIPLDEPFLKYRLATIIGEENKSLQEGRIPISDTTYYLMGTSDPTGTLGPNQVCVNIKGLLGISDTCMSTCIYRDEGQLSGDVLVYTYPGLHPGDIHKLQATYIPDLEEFVGNAKYGIFFPTVGPRSLADEMANSDFDGDMYWVSHNSELLKTFQPSTPWPEPEDDSSKKNAEQIILSNINSEELEGVLFKEFLKNRFEPSPAIGTAAQCWLTYMDRLLTHNSLGENERKTIQTKMEQAVNIYYDALDAPKSGKKVQVPKHLLVDRYPHFMEKRTKEKKSNQSTDENPKERDPYRSTSILGKIYEMVQSFKSEMLQQTEISPLPLFMEGIPNHCMNKWDDLYKEYLPEMRGVSQSEYDNSSNGLVPEIKDAKSKNCQIVIDKYKEILYGGVKDFNSSKKPHSEIYEEACAIYKIAYIKAVGWSDGQVRINYCSFPWRVAGEALCRLYLSKMGNNNYCLVDWDFLREMRR